MYQDHTGSTSNQTTSHNWTLYGGQEPTLLSRSVPPALLLTCVLLSWLLLAFTEIILTESLELFWLMSLPTFSRYAKVGGVSSGKQHAVEESLTSHSWQEAKDPLIFPTSS